MAYIEVRALQKHFAVRQKQAGHRLLREKKIVRALDGVSFSVGRGELIGYIGPNGAGKSTTVKILSGILTPDGGEATVGGLIPWKERKKHVARIGVVFGQRTQLWWDVAPEESYKLLRDIYRVPKDVHDKRLAELTEELRLNEFIRTPLRQLSLGQRMRAELAGSLLHNPELLYLDEPTIGLDAVSKLALRDFLRRENEKRGTTILLTTHDMEDISALCRRVMVLGHGKLLYDGALNALVARYDTHRLVRVRYQAGAKLPELPPCCRAREEDGAYCIDYAPGEIPTADLIGILQRAPIAELTAQGQPLDRMIADMYREYAL